MLCLLILEILDFHIMEFVLLPIVSISNGKMIPDFAKFTEVYAHT